MAITRAQIAKQLLAQGGRTGFQGGGADMGKEKGPETGRAGRDGSGSDFGQFERRQQQNQALQGAGFLGKDLGMNIGEQDRLAKFGDFIRGGGITGNIISSLSNIFPTTVTSPKTFADIKGDNQQMGQIPLWAQLGFNSEAEYLASLEDQTSSIEEQETKPQDEGLRLRFAAEGGMMNDDVVGGEFDFESARQMYGLGKLVKKVGRTVKKIAKSPIGKAALLYTGAAMAGSYGAGKGLFSKGMFNPGNIGRGIFGITAKGQAARGFPEFAAEKGLLGKIGLTGGYGSLMPTALGGITVASALAGLLTPEQEQEAQDLARGEGIDIEEARRSILNAGTAQDFRAIRFRAEGGSTEEKEPVAKKTMPLIDMGGKEKDYRETGGFVDIGRMEKADDVPARLSKNEFVFTADAVRNAGDGSVDKGAEVMYNMMKNLEAGGKVSEESQGLEGARKMFQTSQRLEEVL